jgi:hypothetical protein
VSWQVKPGNQALLGARMRPFEQKQSNGERCRRCKATPYHSSRIRDWNEKDIIAIALTTASISFAAVLDDLKRRLPRALYPLGGGAMTTKEAFDIVLALAFDNMVDEEEMPERYKQQSEALEIVTEIAKYYGSRR